MEAFAIAERELEDAIIGSEDKDVTSGVQYGRTDLTVGEVVFDVGAHRGVEGVIEIAGDLVPDVTAVQNHENLRRGARTALLSCGASCFCSFSRARWRRIFTDAWVMPRASAVSSTLRSSSSRRIKTSR